MSYEIYLKSWISSDINFHIPVKNPVEVIGDTYGICIKSSQVC
jgi:hypothetical protein